MNIDFNKSVLDFINPGRLAGQVGGQLAENLGKVADRLAERLDEAFGFTRLHGEITGAQVWLQLARELLDGSVDVTQWSDARRAAVAGFACTEYARKNGAELVMGSIVTRNLTDHYVQVQGLGEVWTWCFFDALFLPYVICQSSVIRSRCAETGRDIVVKFSAAGEVEVVGQLPVWVSLPVQFTPGASIKEDFCCRSRGWVVQTVPQDGVVVLPLAEAVKVTASVTRRLGF